MPKTVNTRKSRFEAALKLAQMTAKEWAAKNGVTPGHLSQVLSGKHESERLAAKVDDFTTKKLASLA